MSYEDQQGLAMLLWVFVLFLLRKNKPFDTIWEMFKLFMVIVLVICSAGLLAKWVKGWFD